MKRVKVVLDFDGTLTDELLPNWQIDPVSGYLFYLKSLAWGLGWGLACL